MDHIAVYQSPDKTTVAGFTLCAVGGFPVHLYSDHEPENVNIVMI